MLTMTTKNYGHNETVNTALSLDNVEKSGYDSPEMIPYTVDLATPASLAIAVNGLVSADSADASLPATFCASRAEAGAPDSVPVANSPVASHDFGAGAFCLVTSDTLPYKSLAVQEDAHDLLDVCIIGHNGFLESLGIEASMRTTFEQDADELLALSRVVVPASRAIFFATEIPDPTKGQRRQAYIALEVIAEAMHFDDRQNALTEVMSNHPGARRRCDRARVLAAALDVVSLLPRGATLEQDYLRELLLELPVTEKSLQSARSYPQLLVRLPQGEMVFVETHPARKAGGEADAWMDGRLASHFQLGAHIPGFAGVLVFTTRSMKPVHVTGIGSRHRVGLCATCGQVK